MDESYSLEIPGQPGDSSTLQATLSAPTVWGALRGLETFGQLVEWDWDDRSHVIRSAPLHIDDKPRFPHRAFMMDTARHLQPLAVFGRVLDGMAACRLNTLHWHISDAQSVAFESAKYVFFDVSMPLHCCIHHSTSRSSRARTGICHCLAITCHCPLQSKHPSARAAINWPRVPDSRYPKIWEGRWSNNERYSRTDMAYVVE